MKTPEQEIARLQLDVQALQQTLGRLISWIAQSANSPIRSDEASRLLNILNGYEYIGKGGTHDNG